MIGANETSAVVAGTPPQVIWRAGSSESGAPVMIASGDGRMYAAHAVVTFNYAQVPSPALNFTLTFDFGSLDVD